MVYVLGWMMYSWWGKDIWPESGWPNWKTLSKGRKKDNHLDKPMNMVPMEDNKRKMRIWIKAGDMPGDLHLQNIGKQRGDGNNTNSLKTIILIIAVIDWVLTICISLFILETTLQSRYCCYFHFKDGEKWGLWELNNLHKDMYSW